MTSRNALAEFYTPPPSQPVSQRGDQHAADCHAEKSGTEQPSHDIRSDLPVCLNAWSYERENGHVDTVSHVDRKAQRDNGQRAVRPV